MMEASKVDTNEKMVRYTSGQICFILKHFDTRDQKKSDKGEMWKFSTKFQRTFPLFNTKNAVSSYTAGYLWFHLPGCLGDLSRDENKVSVKYIFKW